MRISEKQLTLDSIRSTSRIFVLDVNGNEALLKEDKTLPRFMAQGTAAPLRAPSLEIEVPKLVEEAFNRLRAVLVNLGVDEGFLCAWSGTNQPKS